MIKGRLYQQNYRPQFSGHETFPLRYGWLKKAYDAVRNKPKEERKDIFSRPEAIADFGVGKNMVISIRHWATVMDVITEPDEEGVITTTPFGDLIFSPRGFDPYLENPSTLWLLHWKLTGNPRKTTWYWAFSLFSQRTFERSTIVQLLGKLAEEQRWTRASTATIKRDVECLVRTYVPKRISKKFGFEDSVECPLTELGLIKSLGGRDRFEFVVGPKSSLGMGVFLYALDEFWAQRNTSTISLEAIAHDEGSPGRVFQLDESDLIHRFSQIEKISGHDFRWSETAGLKQLIRAKSHNNPMSKFDSLSLDFQSKQRAISA